MEHMEIGNVPGIGWCKRGEGIVESIPSLDTAGYAIKIVRLSPHVTYALDVPEAVVCLLRGAVTGKNAPILRKSSLVKGQASFKSGEEGCLLLVSGAQDGEYAYFEAVSGLQTTWSEFDNDMYRTVPQIHVDGYRINLWYLCPGKHGGVHNHSTEQVSFVEFHTQLRGSGWMVKYEDREGKRELERVQMLTGYTHDLFCSLENGKPVYPWHEYVAGDDGSLFIAFEDTAI